MRKLVTLILLAASLGANAQTFPAKPVTLLVTFPAGGPTDIAGRALAEATSKYLGQNVVVENRPGATGTLGAAALVNARPDGYTVSMIPITVLRLPHMEIGLAVLVVHTTPLVIFPVSVFVLGSRDELVPRTLFGAFLVLAGITLLAIR